MIAQRIEPGVEVIFETQESGIENNFGQLFILGTVSDRVVLKPKENGWKGITFGAIAISATISTDGQYQSGSVIQYADVIGAGYSTSRWQSKNGFNFNEGVTPYLFDINMINCGGNDHGSIIYINQLRGFFAARHIRMSKNTTNTYFPGYGININGQTANDGSVLLENVDIPFDVRTRALQVQNIDQFTLFMSSLYDELYIQRAATVSITKNEIFSHMQLWRLGENRGTVVVDDNIIDSSNTNGDRAISAISFRAITGSSISRNMIIGGRLYMIGSSSYQSDIIVQDNVITGSRFGGMYVDLYTSPNLQGIFSNNSITDCSYTNGRVIEIYARGDGLSFVNNTINGNTANEIFLLHSSSLPTAESYFFSGNIAKNNIATNALLHLQSNPWTEFSGNIFINNTALRSVKISNMNDFSDDVNALRLPANYWGNFQNDIIDLRITVEDALINLNNKYVVDFNPILNGPSMNR